MGLKASIALPGNFGTLDGGYYMLDSIHQTLFIKSVAVKFLIFRSAEQRQALRDALTERDALNKQKADLVKAFDASAKTALNINTKRTAFETDLAKIEQQLKANEAKVTASAPASSPQAIPINPEDIPGILSGDGGVHVSKLYSLLGEKYLDGAVDILEPGQSSPVIAAPAAA